MMANQHKLNMLVKPAKIDHSYSIYHGTAH